MAVFHTFWHSFPVRSVSLARKVYGRNPFAFDVLFHKILGHLHSFSNSIRTCADGISGEIHVAFNCSNAADKSFLIHILGGWREFLDGHDVLVEHLTIRSSRPRIVASATCLRYASTRPPPRCGAA